VEKRLIPALDRGEGGRSQGGDARLVAGHEKDAVYGDGINVLYQRLMIVNRSGKKNPGC
jgi:hypothetical protein